MIRSDAEHRKAQRDLELALEMLDEERAHWEEEGMTDEEVSAMLEPLRLRIDQLREEIELYDRTVSGDLSMFTGFEDMGKALIAARLALGMSQRDFAELLGVHESQVSRDERNEYHGVGSERLREIMQAVGLKFEGQFELTSSGSCAAP